ncbi:helix-turn-helix domain-containing protein [Krasilnikovia sp. MM14-A1259]|uniref:helix-turn-helix domain-containing protein n=1 Tax=Krasilnikovia sp. MM14-A1259 TaxID=3373539 RepID=UPI003828D3EB
MTELSASNFLVNELRRSRSAAGLSQEDLGKAINYSSSLVSAVENGQRPPTREYLLAADKALQTGGLFERMLATVEWAPVWFRDWIMVEREATLIRWFQPMLVPGLLQTEAYARAVMSWGSLRPQAEAERLIAARMSRQAILAKSSPPQLIAVVDEPVLHRLAGSPAVMAEQFEHLLWCAEQPHVRIHVLPSTAGSHTGLAGPFILARGPEFEVGHLDNALRGELVDQRGDIDRLVRKWEAIRGEALSRPQSLELMREVAKTWQT